MATAYKALPYGISNFRRIREENYYFVGGDNALNSQDSRYWGLLPEPFIVGRAWRIWKSVDEDGRIRWERVLRKIE